jgi:hypothetical protein
LYPSDLIDYVRELTNLANLITSFIAALIFVLLLNYFLLVAEKVLFFEGESTVLSRPEALFVPV